MTPLGESPGYLKLMWLDLETTRDEEKEYNNMGHLNQVQAQLGWARVEQRSLELSSLEISHPTLRPRHLTCEGRANRSGGGSGHEFTGRRYTKIRAL